MDILDAHKHCIRCGSETESKLNQRKCKLCNYRNFVNPSPATGAIILKDHQVMLVKRATEPEKDKLDLPGGFLELDETFEQGIRRELKEELGVEVLELKYFNSFVDTYMFDGVNDHIIAVNFIVTLKEGEIVPADDIVEAKYYDLENLPYDEIAFKSIITSLDLVKQKIKED
jgi:ADP-ribose pyrophosphatase YjhB (NUDIX family)